MFITIAVRKIEHFCIHGQVSIYNDRKDHHHHHHVHLMQVVKAIITIKLTKVKAVSID